MTADSGHRLGRTDAGPLSVLYVINGLGTGGAERSLLELATCLEARGVRIGIATLFRRDVGVEDLFRAQGADLHYIEGSRLLVDRLANLRRLITQKRPTIVHTSIFEADILGRLGAAGTDSFVLTSLVNTSYDPIRLHDAQVRRYRLTAARAVDGWTARHLTHHFHALSHAVKAANVAALGLEADKVSVIPRGRDPARLGSNSPSRRSRVRSRIGLPQQAEVILNVARQEYQKGQEYLLDAMAGLVRERPNAVLLIAGREGAATPRLQSRLADLQLNGRARFLGHRNDVPDLLAASDIFAFPSLYEGQGGALIEAMAMSVPVVASDIPAVREVVDPGETGLLVARGDAGQLRAAIGQLLDDHDYRMRLGDRGRALFMRRYTLATSADCMATLYHQIASART